jgi:hypothetical protein
MTLIDELPSSGGVSLKLKRAAMESVESGKDAQMAIYHSQADPGAEGQVNRGLLTKVEMLMGYADLGELLPFVGWVAAFKHMTIESLVKVFAKVGKLKSGVAPGAHITKLSVDLVDAVSATMGRTPPGRFTKECASALGKAGKKQLGNGMTYIVVLEAVRGQLQDEKFRLLSAPGFEEGKAMLERVTASTDLIREMAMGMVSEDHQALLEGWGEGGKGASKRSHSPTPAAASAPSAPSAPKKPHVFKRGGGFEASGFTHCQKYQHGLCQDGTCPDGREHVYKNCKRTYKPGQKCEMGEDCWFHHL